MLDSVRFKRPVSRLAPWLLGLADRGRVLGADHPQTLTTRNIMAGAYQAAGLLGKAIALYEQTLADRRRALGTDHPDTLTTRDNLERCRCLSRRTGVTRTGLSGRQITLMWNSHETF